jgi:SAM-dependent methyltransferase
VTWALPVLTLLLSVVASVNTATPAAAAATQGAVVLILAATAVSIGRRPHFAWHLAMLMLALGGWRQVTATDGIIERDRSFFGIYAVTDHFGRDMRVLLHGTTLHGMQSRLPGFATTPTSYYIPNSRIGRVMRAAPAIAGPHARIGFVGLGAGTLACYSRPGQDWTAYEIDPVIVAIARNARDFTFLDRCRRDLPVVIGDARLKLAAVPPGRFDILAIDAFSSDAIPLHLLTVEAFRIYARTLTPDGVLLINVTNRFLDLEPVVAAIARAEGWTAQVRHFRPSAVHPGAGDIRSTWIMLTRTPARSAAILAVLPGGADGWSALVAKPGATAWTDDFSSILPAVKFSP